MNLPPRATQYLRTLNTTDDFQDEANLVRKWYQAGDIDITACYEIIGLLGDAIQGKDQEALDTLRSLT